VASLSKARTFFALSNTGIVDSNPTRGMDVSVRSFYACVCVGSGLATVWSTVQGVVPTVYKIKELKKRPRSNKRTLARQMCSGEPYFICYDICASYLISTKLISLENPYILCRFLEEKKIGFLYFWLNINFDLKGPCWALNHAKPQHWCHLSDTFMALLWNYVKYRLCSVED
jgi:hypothetical protein